jgi:hypothetical protein
MTHDELIARAREHMKPFERIDSEIPPLQEYSETRVRDTVMVYFSRTGADDRFEICLDRTTGEFVGASYMPKTKPKSEGGANAA